MHEGQSRAGHFGHGGGLHRRASRPADRLADLRRGREPGRPGEFGQHQGARIGAAWWTCATSSGTLQNCGMVIGEDIHTDNIDFILETNAITEETTVTILHDAGTPGLHGAFQRLDQNLTSILDKSLSPTALPPFTLVPRNAAMPGQVRRPDRQRHASSSNAALRDRLSRRHALRLPRASPTSTTATCSTPTATGCSSSTPRARSST